MKYFFSDLNPKRPIGQMIFKINSRRRHLLAPLAAVALSMPRPLAQAPTCSYKLHLLLGFPTICIGEFLQSQSACSSTTERLA
jgi:hypothetical protein